MLRSKAKKRRRLPAEPRPAGALVCLRLTLRGTEPRIWRRVRVPSTLTLAHLHEVVQVLFAWQNRSLHEFHVGGHEIHEADGLIDERATRVADVVGRGRRFVYTYDFRDEWHVDVEVEDHDVSASGARLECLAGSRAAPPEDAGGVRAYQTVLASLRPRKVSRTAEAGAARPSSVTPIAPTAPAPPVGRDTVPWLPPAFDPARFDLKGINIALSYLEVGWAHEVRAVSRAPASGVSTSSDATRRVLDMLAGWAIYAESNADPAEAQAIADLYAEASERLREQPIHDFVASRVLPLLERGRDAHDARLCS